MKNRNTLLMLCVFALGSVLFSLPASAQTDSDLVRAAKDKSAHKAKHVYTESDIPEHTVATTPETAPGGDDTGAKASDSDGEGGTMPSEAVTTTQADVRKTGDGKSDARSDGKTDPKNEPESKRQAKLADLKDKLVQTKENEQALRQKLEALDEKAKNEKDEFRKDMYRDMVSNQQVTLSEYRREEEELQRQIDSEGRNEVNTENKEPQ